MTVGFYIDEHEYTNQRKDFLTTKRSDHSFCDRPWIEIDRYN